MPELEDWGVIELNPMIANASGIFQQLMSVVLGGLEQFAMAYLDDILIFSASVSEHLKHLKTVFARLRKHGVKIKLSKCQLMKKETKYPGFVIDESGVHPDIDKVEVIRAIPEPRTVKEVRRFIGAIGNYRKFIPAFSRIATPLIALTRKYAQFSRTKELREVIWRRARQKGSRHRTAEETSRHEIESSSSEGRPVKMSQHSS